MSIERTVPKVLGAVGLAMTVGITAIAPAFPSVGAWAVYTGLWMIAAATLLLAPRWTRVAAAGLAALAFIGVFWPVAEHREPYCLFAWVAFIVAWTVGRPDDRALLLKVCGTAVYAYTAMTKLNPAFLNGEQLVFLIDTRAHLEVFRPLVESAVAPVLALSTVIVEASVPALLWWPRSRRLAAMGGVMLHVTLIALATLSVGAFFELISLNSLLVLTYAGFLYGGPSPAHATATPGLAVRGPALARLSFGP